MSSLLVAWSAKRLFVWDLLSLSLWWSFELNVTHLAVHPKKPHFVVFSKDTQSKFLSSSHYLNTQNLRIICVIVCSMFMLLIYFFVLFCFSLLSQTETQKKSNIKSSSTKTKSTTKDILQGGYLILFNAHDPKPLCYWKIRGLVKGVCFLPFKDDQPFVSLKETKRVHSEKPQSDEYMIVYLNAFQEFKFFKEMTLDEYNALKKRRNLDLEEENEKEVSPFFLLSLPGCHFSFLTFVFK
jgi:hypothetical protein